MSAQDKVNEIMTKLEEYFEKNADPPRYLLLSVAARQAIKLYCNYPFEPSPIESYFGIHIIPLEEAIIVQ